MILKNVPLKWAKEKLSDVCNTTSGGTPSRMRKDYFRGDIPWLKSGELTDGLVSDIEEYITKEAVSNSSAKIFPSGTLLIALYGATVGKLGILTRDAATNQAVCAIFPQNGLDQRFSVINELETLAEANLRRTTRLHQSILKKAFSGNLIR